MLTFCFDILHAIAALIRASHCIAAESDHLEVSAVSIVSILWAKEERKLTWISFQIIYFSLNLWIGLHMGPAQWYLN